MKPDFSRAGQDRKLDFTFKINAKIEIDVLISFSHPGFVFYFERPDRR